MESSSSIVAMEIETGQDLVIKPKTMPFPKEELKLIIESAVDFKSLKRNGCDITFFINIQEWMPYFEMLHGR
jgi:hypothetical protein